MSIVRSVRLYLALLLTAVVLGGCSLSHNIDLPSGNPDEGDGDGDGDINLGDGDGDFPSGTGGAPGGMGGMGGMSACSMGGAGGSEPCEAE